MACLRFRPILRLENGWAGKSAVHLPLQNPDAAADEAERAFKELHMPSVVIGTNVQGKNLDMPEFWPFFGRMNDLEAVRK
jgi:hypothetical protein